MKNADSKNQGSTNVQYVQYASNNNTDPNTAPNNDGLLIHIDNGSIVAEPVGIADSQARNSLPSDGRRLVIPAGEASNGITDIIEEAPPKADGSKVAGSSPLAQPDGETSSSNGNEQEQEDGDDEEADDASRRNSTDRLMD
jgi:hypothetical protein